MFTAGSFAEAYFAIFGWSAIVFFLWYFFGAALNAGWIGHGTLMLLVRKRWRHVVTGLLIVGSVAATVLMFSAMANLDPGGFNSEVAISEQYREIMPPIDRGGAVRLTTPFFNIYGLITLVGGALWSAWLFLRKRVLPNRVLGNVLIAAGALSIGAASTLTRMGYGQLLYLGELVAAVLMYTGFILAGQPATEQERQPALSVSRN
jgi:drug/metabolite transporter (DMT)-like permease